MQRHALVTLAAALSAVTAAPASAAIINIAGGPSGWGCAQCFGGPGVLSAGQTVDLVNTGQPGPLTLTLGAGTYSITNGATSGTYSAFRFDGGNNWAWNWVIGKDLGSNKSSVFKVGYTGVVGSTQAQVANATGIASYSFGTILNSNTSTAAYYDTFTLAATTTLDFFIVDGYLDDNAGGVSLNITQLDPATPAVPEPASWALMLTGFAAVGGALRGQRKLRKVGPSIA